MPEKKDDTIYISVNSLQVTFLSHDNRYDNSICDDRGLWNIEPAVLCETQIDFEIPRPLSFDFYCKLMHRDLLL